jgi:hypothetical protein
VGRLTVILAVVVIIALGLRWFSRSPPELIAQRVRQSLVGVVLAALLLLAVTGHLHWLFALIGAGIAFLMRALPLLLRYLPIVASFMTDRQAGKAQQAAAPVNMSAEEALAVLGLSGNPSREEIVNAHRRLIQKIHPDRGGSDHLAAQINKAKDVLLGS